MHLKGQLALAQATIEAKDATIQAQRERLIFQGQIMEGRLLPEPSQQKTKQRDTEEILGGAIELKDYEGKGFNVKLPKLYRELRDLVKKDKKD